MAALGNIGVSGELKPASVTAIQLRTQTPLSPLLTVLCAAQLLETPVEVWDEGGVGGFYWVPSYDMNVTTEPRVRLTKFGDGYEQRVVDGINLIAPKYDLRFENRKLAEANAIEAFLTARGAIESFRWTPPGGVSGFYICRSWRKAITDGYLFNLDMQFEKVYG